MAEGKKTIFAVENMSCGHCATRVTKAIKRLAPQSEVDVDLTTGAVTVTPAVADPAGVAKAIAEAGYPARATEHTL